MHLKITTIFYSLLRCNAEVISRYLEILGNKFLQTSVRRNFSMARQNHDEINITKMQIARHHSSLGWFIWTQHIDQLPVGLLAQLVERYTCIAVVMGSNPVRA